MNKLNKITIIVFFILIIFAVIGKCKAQDTGAFKFNIIFEDEIYPKETQFINSSIFTARDLIELYEKYEEYCYSDSTEIIIHIKEGYEYCVGYSHSIGHFVCESPGHYNKKVWKHKQPNGMDHDFIEWLKTHRNDLISHNKPNLLNKSPKK